jgi:hypothetical protein
VALLSLIKEKERKGKEKKYTEAKTLPSPNPFSLLFLSTYFFLCVKNQWERRQIKKKKQGVSKQ